jgi:RND family efflux transporter MFP subunit
MKKKKSFIVIIVVAVLIILLVSAKMLKNPATSDTQNLEKSVAVETALSTLGNIDGKLSYTGNVEGINEAVVVSQTTGTIEKVYAQVGNNCSAGTVLVAIENEMQKAGVEQAKAQVIAAETNYEKAKKDLERIEKLYSENVATKDNLELSQLNTKAAMAQLKGAQAGLKVAEKQLSDTYIKSTIAGKIASKDVNLGGNVTPGTKIATIVDNSKIKIKTMVSESDISKIKSGQPVSVKIDAIPGKEFKGKVNTIGLTTDKSGRSYEVEIIISSNENGQIKSGMFARCDITTEEKSGTIIVPEGSVIINNDGSAQIYVIEKGKAYLKQIKLGIKTDGSYEIVSGISPNTKVVTTGKERLKDGIEVIEK